MSSDSFRYGWVLVCRVGQLTGVLARNLALVVALMLPWMLATATPSLAAVQTVNCSGTITPGTSSIIRYLHSSRSCVATDGLTGDGESLGDMSFSLNPNSFEEQFLFGIGGNENLFAHDGCAIGSFTAAAGVFCLSDRNTNGNETATATKYLVGGITVTMTVNYTVGGGGTSLTLTGASVAITIPDPTAQDKTNINNALSNAFDAFSPSLLTGLPRSGGVGASGSGLSFASTGSNNLSFALDMVNMLATARNGDGLSDGLVLGYAGDGADGSAQTGALNTPFNSWLTGNYVRFDDDTANADRDGHVWIVSGGVSYDLDEVTTIGVLSRYRDGKADSSALGATLETKGFGAGIFMTTRVLDGVNIAVASMFEGGSNDISIGGVTGDYDSKQISLEANIDGRVGLGEAAWLQPAIGLSYRKSTSDDYTDSSSTLVNGIDSTTGTLTYGVTIGTAINGGEVAILPFAKIGGIWNFDNDGDLATSTAGTFVALEKGANLGAGVTFVFASGVSLKLAADVYRFDSEIDAWSVTSDLDIPLRAMGIESEGDVSLAMMSKAGDASAAASLKMPLN